jgi:predicted permease
MDNIVFSLGIIFLGLSLGYAIQILVHNQFINIPIDIQILRKKLQKIGLLYLSPVVFLGAVWIINFDELNIIALPFVGIIALSLGGLLAFVFAGLLNMSRKQTGAYIVSGGFTNIGSIGGLICFTLLGEIGFALVSFYKLFETFAYYGIGFPIARSYSADITQSESFVERAKKIFTDPFVVVSTTSMVLGIILNISGVERPEIFSGIIAVFVPVASFLLLSSIGMALSFGRARKYIKEGLLIALVKFTFVPAVVMTISYSLGLGNIEDGLPLKVVLILSSMPVGFTAMVPPTIYDLDIDLSNASWIVTNSALIFVVPMLQYLITLF